MTGDNWEEHAEWWQREFTEGADPEYERADPAAGRRPGWPAATGCSTSAPARARWRGGSPSRGAELVVGRRPDRRPGRGGRPARRRAAYAAGGAVAAAVRRRLVRRGRGLPGVRAHRRPRRGHRRGGPGAARPAGASCFFLNHPLLQTPGSGWIDDQILDPPEQYWRIGPYLAEDVDSIEEVEQGVFIRFVHRPLGRYVNALADAGLVLERMVEPAPPPGFLARAAEYAEAATHPAGCSSLVTPTAWPAQSARADGATSVG